MTTVIDAESVPAEAAPPAEPARTRRRPRWYARAASVGQGQGTKIIVFVLALAFLIAYLAPDIFVSVRSGEVAVVYLRFFGGTQTDRVLGEGMKIVLPWDRLFIYNVRVQEAKHSMEVLSSEGLTVRLELSVRYHPELELVGLLHQRVGPDYKEKIVIPEVEQTLRTTMAGLDLHQVYGSQRTVVQSMINDSLEHVAEKYVKIDEIVVREIRLPDKVRNEIEQKIVQREIVESYQYRLEVARLEAQRQTLEANGIRDYNQVIDRSLSANILRWQGIEATRELAKSPNAKTVVIGNREGLPLILGETVTAPVGGVR